MLQHEVIELDDILPWLVPDDKSIVKDHALAMKQAKEYVRKMSVISTKDKEEVPEEKENPQVRTNEEEKENNKIVIFTFQRKKFRDMGERSNNFSLNDS